MCSPRPPTLSQRHIDLFACVGIPMTWLYIPSFIEIRSGVSEPLGVKIWPFPLLWLVAITTACTTVQDVITDESHEWVRSRPYLAIILIICDCRCHRHFLHRQLPAGVQADTHTHTHTVIAITRALDPKVFLSAAQRADRGSRFLIFEVYVSLVHCPH